MPGSRCLAGLRGAAGGGIERVFGAPGKGPPRLPMTPAGACQKNDKAGGGRQKCEPWRPPQKPDFRGLRHPPPVRGSADRTHFPGPAGPDRTHVPGPAEKPAVSGGSTLAAPGRASEAWPAVGSRRRVEIKIIYVIGIDLAPRGVRLRRPGGRTAAACDEPSAAEGETET